MRPLGMWILIAAIVLLSGCPQAEADAQSGGGDSNPATTTAPDTASEPVEKEASQPAAGDEEQGEEEERVVIAQTEKEDGPLNYRYELSEVSDGYLFSLIVTNISKSALAITYSSGDTREFTVVREEKTLWSSNAGLRFTQAFQTKMLGARESMEYSAHWGGKVREGEDIGTAPFTIHAEHKPVNRKATLTIEDVTLPKTPAEPAEPGQPSES